MFLIELFKPKASKLNRNLLQKLRNEILHMASRTIAERL